MEDYQLLNILNTFNFIAIMMSIVNYFMGRF